MKAALLFILTLLSLSAWATDPEQPKYCREEIPGEAPIYKEVEVYREYSPVCESSRQVREDRMSENLSGFCMRTKRDLRDQNLTCRTENRYLDSDAECENATHIAYRSVQSGTRTLSLKELTQKSCESLTRCLAKAMNKGDGKGLAYVSWMSTNLGCM